MIPSPIAVSQAAAEYGSATSAAGEVRNSLNAVTGSARGAFETLSNNPVILVGILLFVVLLLLFFRDPVR